MDSATETKQCHDDTRKEFVHATKVKSLSSSFPRGEAVEQLTCLGKPQVMQVSWLRFGGRLTLELRSDSQPREIYVEIQNPAYYLWL